MLLPQLQTRICKLTFQKVLRGFAAQTAMSPAPCKNLISVGGAAAGRGTADMPRADEHRRAAFRIGQDLCSNK